VIFHPHHSLLSLPAVQENFAQERFVWRQISPANISGCEQIISTKSKRLLAFTENLGVLDAKEWTEVNSNLPVISDQIQRVRALTVAHNGIWGIAQRNLVFLNDTSNRWAVSALSTNLSINNLHYFYFNGLYASAGALVPDSERLLYSNDDGKTWVEAMQGFPRNAIYVSSFIRFLPAFPCARPDAGRASSRA
jgi:photosystem II stability/assembly factor-like uncharacterized protein